MRIYSCLLLLLLLLLFLLLLLLLFHLIWFSLLLMLTFLFLLLLLLLLLLHLSFLFCLPHDPSAPASLVPSAASSRTPSLHSLTSHSPPHSPLLPSSPPSFHAKWISLIYNLLISPPSLVLLLLLPHNNCSLAARALIKAPSQEFAHVARSSTQCAPRPASRSLLLPASYFLLLCCLAISAPPAR